jgi:predicted GNAT superfamily acetyltransferase
VTGWSPQRAELSAADAAGRARVDVRLVGSMAEAVEVDRLLASVWRPGSSTGPVPREMLRALSHAGAYVAAAHRDGETVGASVGFLAPPDERTLHSHVTAVATRVRNEGVGHALKLHQRAWAWQRGLRRITWTFDPLVARNAHLDICRLGARPVDYLVDFYGDVDDVVNDGQPTDRLLVTWPVDDPLDAVAQCAKALESDLPALVVAADGTPRRLETPDGAKRVTVQVPGDILAVRAEGVAAALAWRRAVRDVLGGLMGEGYDVRGFTSGGSYVLHRAES